jgi:hypothetical protein
MAEVEAEPKKPFYSSPFFIAFICGAISLTVLPILQKKFLKAAPPLGSLPEFSLPKIGTGESFSKANLSQGIWIVSLVPNGCTGHCWERQIDFAKAHRNVADLKQIHLMRLVSPEVSSDVAKLADAEVTSLECSGTSFVAVENTLKELWKIQGTGEIPNGSVTTWGAFMVIDEKAQVRGFWPDDIAGLGNAINAARLLAKLNLETT